MTDDSARPWEDLPGTRLRTWSTYVLMMCEGYLIYAIGFITPYVRQDLDVPPWVAALPSSAVAVGITIGGAATMGLNARVGGRAGIRAWALLMAVAGVLLAIPVSIVPIVIGALFYGMSCGGVIVYSNSSLGTGPRGATMLMRANLWSMTGGLLGPLVLSAAAASLGWWLGSLVPVPVLLVLAFLLQASPAHDRTAKAVDGDAALPVAYWLSWTYLALCVAVEFSFVAWGAQVVTARTGIDMVAATGLASLFVAGMAIGRLVLSAGHRTAGRQMTILRGVTALAFVGATITWLAPRPELAALGLFLGGLGVAGIYPLAATLAIAHAPRSPVRASSRLTAASGVSIFIAPLAVGVAVGVFGIAAAWIIVLGLLVVALVLLLRIPIPTAAVDHADLIEG